MVWVTVGWGFPQQPPTTAVFSPLPFKSKQVITVTKKHRTLPNFFVSFAVAKRALATTVSLASFKMDPQERIIESIQKTHEKSINLYSRDVGLNMNL